MNSFLVNLWKAPEKLVLPHFLIGLVCALVPAVFIPFFYTVLIVIGSWAINSRKDSSNTVKALFFFFYLMMFESVSRLLALSPLIPWEIGKYLTILLIVYLLYKGETRPNGWFYLGLLLLGITLVKGVTFRLFLFNGSIFIALLLLSGFASRVRMNQYHLEKLLKILILPLVLFLGASVTQLQDFQDIQYELDSNYVLDQIPANQVSTYMGVGFVLVTFSMFLNPQNRSSWKSYLLPAAFLFVGLLSFSRGGIIAAALAIAVMLYGLVSTGKGTYLLTAIVVGLLASPIVLYVNEVTDGKLFLRYQGETRGTLAGSKEKTLDHLTTGRISIFLGDWQTFLEHPVIGVPVGVSNEYREGTETQHSHVELSRILAEHGIMGFIGFLSLFIPVFRTKRNAGSIRYLMLGLWCLGMATTFHAATRTVVPLVFLLIPFMQIRAFRNK